MKEFMITLTSKLKWLLINLLWLVCKLSSISCLFLNTQVLAFTTWAAPRLERVNHELGDFRNATKFESKSPEGEG